MWGPDTATFDIDKKFLSESHNASGHMTWGLYLTHSTFGLRGQDAHLMSVKV